MKKDDGVLDMATGCGIQGIFASEKAEDVTATDINPNAIECAKRNIELNDIRNMSVFYSNLFENVEGKFDLILFNPPYLPSDYLPLNVYKEGGYLKRSWDGGEDGRKLTDKFIEDVKDFLKHRGRIQNRPIIAKRYPKNHAEV